jgi:hypothetical protein
MGIDIGSMFILASGMALLGILGPAITRGAQAVGEMGKGLLWASGGLLAIFGTFTLINLISGGPKQTQEIMMSAIKAIGLMGLVFAGLGKVSPLITFGSIAVQQMGEGMLWVAGGLLALGGSYALLSLFGVDLNEMIYSVAKGIGMLGLVFAGIGLFSPLILLGVAPLIAMSVAIGIFAVIALGIGALIRTIGGKDGIVTMEENLSLLIGGVLQGVVKGMSYGLLGEEGSTKGFFGKVGTVAKNIAILTRSIFLLTGVSTALIMFAFALKAFTSAGVIRTVTGYKENGDPIFGDSIDVVYAGQNIARSIGSFFTTLVKTFEDPNIIPSAAKMAVLSQLLLGVKGPKLLGMRLYSAEVPGILDAVEKFANVISVFAKVNQLPVYKKDGSIDKFISPETVAKNIVGSLSAFFGAFKKQQDVLSNLSNDTMLSFAETLLGRESFRFLGLKVGRNRPGLLEPIKVFSDLIGQYAKYGESNVVPIYDKDGKEIGTKPVAEVASSMVTGISKFLSVLSTTLAGKDLDKEAGNISSKLDSFGKIVKKFSEMAEAQEGVDKLANSMGLLASNIGFLVTNMSNLNTEKLASLAAITAQHAVTTKGISTEPSSSTTPSSSNAAPPVTITLSDADLERLGAVIARQISNSRSGVYDFTFWDGKNGGKLQIK